jgi:hypothetical protein
MRILICGDRNWNNLARVKEELVKFKDVEAVIEGECRGADSCGRIAALELGIPVLKFPADWSRYRYGAGPIRNQQMIDEGKPDLVIAFHSDFQNSKGTKDMITRAKKAKIKIILVDK